MHPQKFLNYFQTLPLKKQKKILSLIKIENLFDHLFPPHNLQENQIHLQTFFTLYSQENLKSFLSFLKTLLSHYDKNHVKQILEETIIQQFITTWIHQIISRHSHQEMKTLLSFTHNKDLKEYIFPILLQEIASPIKKQKKWLTQILNSDCATLFFPLLHRTTNSRNNVIHHDNTCKHFSYFKKSVSKPQTSIFIILQLFHYFT